MKVVRETAVAGRTIYQCIKVPSGRHTGKRKPKTMPTQEKVQKNNDRLAARNLTLLLNANFYERSGHFTLTYAGDEPSKEEAERSLKNFLRRMGYAMRKEGKQLKYVAVTEYLHKRIHHHVVMNTTDVEKVNEVWKAGYTNAKPLDKSGSYKQLAEYLIKETSKTMRQDGAPSRRRWSASKNLRRPVLKREEVSESMLSEDPRPLKGYVIDEVRRFTHPVTGLEHLEYFMVATDTPRKYKVWPRGQVIDGRESFEYEHIEQETFWL